MKRCVGLASAVALLCATEALATSVSEITIYNQNLALVKKHQELNLKQGINEIIFDEVAEQMKPESVFIFGKGVRVLEQNYDYQGINQLTLLNANIGKKVKTVRQNPTTGKNIYDEAVLLAVDGVNPILQFDYGIEASFAGQVLFDSIPAELNSTPILMAKVETKEEGIKDLGLAYLSSGFTWSANYVAKVNDKDTLSLQGRAAITNNSGSGYEKAKVSLIAGDVNVVQQALRPRAMLKSNSVMFAATANGAFEDEAVIDAPRAMDSYYIYQIPELTTLKNGQIKQIAFLNAPQVKYTKEGVLNSSLYFNTNRNSYKDVHPAVFYHFINDKDNGLGMPLPQGKVSFYAPDKDGSLQFIGENMIDNKAEGQKISLNLGKFFDIYGKGEIREIKKIDEKQSAEKDDACLIIDKKYHYDVVYEVVNKSDETQRIVLKQPLYNNARIVNESYKGQSGEGNFYEWQFDLYKGQSQEIKVEVENTLSDRVCP